MKRLLDATFSIIAIIVLTPIYITIYLFVRIRLGTPVLFKQKRPGLNGKPFYLYKFRSMTNKYGSDRNLLPDHMRLTSFGMFLRKYSLDELPQLFNVIKGDLSFVGPRPLLMEYLPRYTHEQMRRHEVRPGITGWAQVNGRNAISWEEKFKLDVWYVNNRSFWLDIKIIWMTILKVIKTEGIQQQGHATVERFRGTTL